MTTEDLLEMTRLLAQEELLHAHGFEPLLPDGRELFTRTGAEHPELYSRPLALVSALAELTARGRGYRPHADSLTSQTETDNTGVIDVKDDQLRAELDELERRVRELRGARHAITYDLEQSLKERDRLRRHLTTSHGPREEAND